MSTYIPRNANGYVEIGTVRLAPLRSLSVSSSGARSVPYVDHASACSLLTFEGARSRIEFEVDGDVVASAARWLGEFYDSPTDVLVHIEGQTLVAREARLVSTSLEASAGSFTHLFVFESRNEITGEAP